MSTIRYASILLTNLNPKQLKVMNTLVTKMGRRTIGYHSFRWSNRKLLEKCKWLCGTHSIVYSILCLIHKLNIYNQPKLICDLIQFKENNGSRFTKCPESMKYKSKKEKLNSTSLYKGILLYRKLPKSFKSLEMNKFKKLLKVHISERMPLDRINTYRDYV